MVKTVQFFFVKYFGKKYTKKLLSDSIICNNEIMKMFFIIYEHYELKNLLRTLPEAADYLRYDYIIKEGYIYEKMEILSIIFPYDIVNYLYIFLKDEEYNKYGAYIHKLYWDSFDFEPINKYVSKLKYLEKEIETYKI